MSLFNTLTFLLSFLLAPQVEQIDQTPQELLKEIKRNIELNQGQEENLYFIYKDAAIDFTKRGNYSVADSLFVISEKYITKQLDSTAIIEMITYRALMYKIQGKFTNSIKDYLLLLNYYDKRNDKSGLVYTYARLAEFYRARENEEQTLDALKNGFDLFDSNTDSAAAAYLFSRMAAYQNQFKHNIDSTIYYALKGEEWSTKERSEYTKTLLFNELAYAYMHKDLNDSTRILDYFNRSIQISQENSFYRDLLTAYDNLALYNYRIGNTDEVIRICRMSIAMGLSNGWEYAIDFSYELLADNLRQKGQYEESNQLYKKAFGIRADNNRKQYNKEVAELQAIFEQEQTELELLSLQEERKSERYALFATLGLMIVFSALALITLILLKRVRKVNGALIETQKETVRTNLELKEVLKEKEVLYKELNHRVKNNLTVLSGLIYMQEDAIKDENGRLLYEALRQRIQAMAMVHEKLYSLTNSTSVNFQDYLDELVPVLYSSLLTENISFDYSINCKKLSLTIDKAIPLALIFNELITNSAKHGSSAQAKNLISIECTKLDNLVRIVYRDSGPGLPKSNTEEKTASMGIKIVNMMALQLRAKITSNSSQQGLTYIIDMP